MSSSIERGVLWDHLFVRKGLKVDARWGLLNDKVRIYRITKGDFHELIGRLEAPTVLIAALESKKKTIPLKVVELSKTELLTVAQAIVRDLIGKTDDWIGGAREVLQILRKLDVPPAPPVLVVRREPRKREEKPEGKPEVKLEAKSEEKKPEEPK